VLNNEYELTVIFRPDLDDAATAAGIEKVESIITENEGTLLLRDDWGKRKLAYGIKKHLKGHYVLLTFAAPAALITELERRMRLDDSILRFLTVQTGHHIDLDERVEEARVEQAQRDEAARLRAEAEATAAAAAAEAEEQAKAYAEAQAQAQAQVQVEVEPAPVPEPTPEAQA
jgi:small subunit ribosomal protein S6